MNQCEEILTQIKKAFVGKKDVARKILMTMLAGGHVLLEDIPGVGKTTLAVAFSNATDLQYKRIQFTPDVLPSDITGFTMFNLKTGEQELHQGSIMNQIVLADEINRTSPKTQSALLEVMQDDYIRTARAKGLREWGVIVGHALKNAMLPVVTMMALQVSSMLSGAVLTESVFGVPGIGRLAVNAIETRDMPLLQGTVIFTTILIIAGNLVADLLYNVLDPRIREGA